MKSTGVSMLSILSVVPVMLLLLLRRRSIGNLEVAEESRRRTCYLTHTASAIVVRSRSAGSLPSMVVHEIALDAGVIPVLVIQVIGLSRSIHQRDKRQQKSIH